jgi:hypothetical protein
MVPDTPVNDIVIVDDEYVKRSGWVAECIRRGSEHNHITGTIL